MTRQPHKKSAIIRTPGPIGLAEGALIAETTEPTLRRHALKGLIPYERLFGRITFTREDLETYAARRRERAPLPGAPPRQVRQIARIAARHGRDVASAVARQFTQMRPNAADRS